MAFDDYRYSDSYDPDFEIEKLRENKMQLKHDIEEQEPMIRERLEADLRWLWSSMCEYDNIKPDSLVVRFSPGNPHRFAFNEVICKMSAAGMEIDFRPDFS